LIEPKLHLPVGVSIRPYQNSAYQRWLENDFSGIFAMATGTGKTITSLNCVYQEYLKAKTEHLTANYHLLILVPTQPLLHQWSREIETWGAKSIYRVSGETNWRRQLHELLTDIQFGLDVDFVIIATYRSFVHPDFLSVLSKLPEDMILIADEAHNIGQRQVQTVLESVKIHKKIGLSATPKRIYDPEGTMGLEQFFNDHEPYTFTLYMDEAIESGSLCKYDYFPKLVELTHEELLQYTDLSIKIARLSNFSGIENAEIIERLLLKRKRIVNKATGKISALAHIIKEIQKKEKLHFCFIYAPAGDVETGEEQINTDNIRLIRKMQKVVEAAAPGIRTHAYLGETEDREDVLKSFSKGEIDLLLAIHCLDEGVDVPRTSIGIFTSSTGNPRQYIQRRGRLLRRHPDKSRALIYDMVVIPQLFAGEIEATNFNIQKSLVKNELMRVGYFAKLSENFYDAKEILQQTCDYYGLDLDTLIKDLER
jgi:superfamily II DNA or RNA helicase